MKRASVLVVIILALAGITLAARYLGNGSEPPRLATATVTRGPIVETVNATGTLEAVTTVEVGTQVSGTIKVLQADFNDQVRKGQVIARLEPSLFQTQVDQAQANVARAEAEVERLDVAREDARVKLERARALAGQQLISHLDLENAEVTLWAADAQLASARAALTQARATLNQHNVNLGHTVIRSPIDGIVISRNVDVGQTVAASMQAPTLFVLAADLTEMQVNASIDEADVGRVQSDQPVRFRVDAFPEREFDGRVKQVRLQPTTVQNVVTYTAVITADNPGQLLKPGMTASVTIAVARRDDALQVPAAALRFRPDAGTLAALGYVEADSEARGPAVWVSGENRLARVAVRPGLSNGAATEVRPVGAELREGAEVVIGIGSSAAPASQTATQNPFAPQRPRRTATRGGANR